MDIIGKIKSAPTCESRRFRDCEDRPRRLKAQIFSVLTIFSGVIYLSWIYNTFNRDYPFAGGLFIFAEFCCLMLFVLATVVCGDSGSSLWRVFPQNLHFQ
ncbi:hypothetical protein [Desulfonatronovibrio magnus]|uniref:hypothetical protein n=1 Tax=Desulfonatronovibrio magnus TaxID=698827 RepID=UPI0005EAF127|nr:hypothetical protein [Desulfonatronovibrio magnus]